MITESGSLQIQCTWIPKRRELTQNYGTSNMKRVSYDGCQIKCPRNASVHFQVKPKHLSKRASPISLQSAAGKVPSAFSICLHPLRLYMVLDQDTIERSCRC